ncbi:MAG: hypothetical protein QM736_06795 [Vicinamibacterales bacterium]
MKALTDYSWPGNVRELENVIERLVVTVHHPVVQVADLPSEVRTFDPITLRPKRERRRTVADDLYKRLVEGKESFWTTVYPLFMDREITRSNVREIRAPRARRSPRQLQNRGAPLQYGAARLQALPQLPQEARLPDLVQGIPVDQDGPLLDTSIRFGL